MSVKEVIALIYETSETIDKKNTIDIDLGY